MSPKLPRVLILYTGGTFGMDEFPLDLPKLSPRLLGQRLRSRVPELGKLAHCDIEIVLNCDSAHVGPDEWLMVAERIRGKWTDYDGIVVLHGTDTLSYTASALSLLLRPCLKPVVLTGAQRPLAALRTDARRNLISAVEIAARGPRTVVGQVSVFFDNRLLQGNRTRKRSASEFDAFESPKAPPLALVGTEIRYDHSAAQWLRKRSPRTPLKPRFSRRVAVLEVTPGFPAQAVTEGLLPGLEGLVLVVFPSGTAPTQDEAFMRLLSEARKRDLPVVVVNQSAGDGAMHGSPLKAPAYSAGKEVLAAGAYWGGCMTVECAYVKTALLLGQPEAARNFKRLWNCDLAAEGI
ncbi:MAG: asparaginase [Oligoflexia bacterium]|nr:asparaginase [Oligoflexia bacterium]